jgi:threonine dehydrogenase-like Zn-dependent dehydrogenase
MKTKRAYLTAVRKFEICEETISAGPGEVLVKIESCGLCNWELNHWKGLLGTCPQTLGHEWGGIIVETGRDSSGFKVGDRVTGLPENLEGFAEHGLFKSDHCFAVSPKVPPGLALGEPLKCVVTVLRAASPEAGDTGVVLGCGAMGLLCIQVLRGNLLGRIVAVDVDETRLALARQFGATNTINASKEKPLEALAGLTNGRMADFAIEGTGRPEQLEQAIRVVRNGRGRVVLMSSHERAAEAFDFRPAIEKAVEIRVAHPGYSLNPIDDQRRAVDLLNSGVFSLERIVTHRFSLADIEKAFQSLEAKPAGYMKGIVVP